MFTVPANNRFGKLEASSPSRLKTIRELSPLTVFFLFAILFLKEQFRWNYLVASQLTIGAVYFLFLSQSK